MADNISTTPGSGASIAADDVGGVLHQRVKISVGADGAATDVSSAAPMPVDSELAAAAALADGAANPTTAAVGAAGLSWNGATWDRQRGNLEGTLLASAARTATASTAAQTNYNHRGVILFWKITVAGTGNLTLFLYNINPVSTAGVHSLASAAVTTTGERGYELYPGASSAAAGAGDTFIVQRVAASLARQWGVTVVHSDGSSWTYSLGYSLII